MAMTDRTVRIKIEAIVDSYRRAMRDAAGDTDRLSRQVDMAPAHAKRMSAGFASAGLKIGGTLAGLAGGAGIGALVTSSVKAAASFETMLRQIAVAAGAPASAVQGLSDLAIKMGKDTTFSAQQAADAMLELAKGGLSEAQIRAGALEQTLTLASAGGLELGEAASYMVQGLSVFNLRADKAADVAAALAGGANASTASVQDMGMALSQVGSGAKNAGLNLQETVAVLSAFAQNGIKGSDSGTTLKTMLARLSPQTKEAAVLMKQLGLNFVNAKGNFKDITDVAQQLHDKLGPLSEAQRTNALNTLFGSDASRAAAVLMKEGARGLEVYLRATNDKTQADKLAKAATEGTAGAMEQMNGAIDTAKLQLGMALAPLVTDLAGHVGDLADAFGEKAVPQVKAFIDGMQNGTGPGGEFVEVLESLGGAASDAWDVVRPMFSFIADHPKLFSEITKDALLLAGAMKAISLVKKFPALSGGGVGGPMGAASTARPVPVFVTNFAGTPGRGGVPPIIAGAPGAPGTPPQSRFGKIMASSMAVNAVIVADMVLVPKAVQSLKTVWNLSYDLSVKDAADQFLKDLESPNTDARTKAILQKHAVAVFEGVAEAARTGDTKLLQQALQDTYADVKAAASAATVKTVKDIVGQYKTGGVEAGKGFNSNLSDLLRGSLPKPKVDLDPRPAVAKVNELYRKLERLDNYTARATVDIALQVSGYQTSLRSAERMLGVDVNDNGRVGAAMGGYIRGAGTGTSDSIPAMLSNGEYVVNAASTVKHRELLDMINGGGRFASASAVGSTSIGHRGDRVVHLTYHEAGHLSRPDVARDLGTAEFLLGS